MERGPRSRIGGRAEWVAPLLVALVLGTAVAARVGGGFLLSILIVLTAVRGAFLLVTLRQRAQRSHDPLAEEEGGCRRRLTSLQVRVEQMQATLRDLRVLALSPDDTRRAEWAEIELEEALRQTRRAMAKERTTLFLVESIRWLETVEPLLQDLRRLDEDETAAWLERLPALKSRGEAIRARLQADAEAAGLEAGGAVSGLLREALSEVEALRAELVLHRAYVLARREDRPEAAGSSAAGPEHPALGRLSALLREARARREVSSWLGEM